MDEQQQPVKRDNPTEVHWLATAGHSAAGTLCRFVKLFKFYLNFQTQTATREVNSEFQGILLYKLLPLFHNYSKKYF